ncbi:MAG: hypothetical protein ACI30D_00300 [Muribaculaceae bacterium]|nr:hypothetical protein [Muribaculaceae bacterium]
MKSGVALWNSRDFSYLCTHETNQDGNQKEKEKGKKWEGKAVVASRGDSRSGDCCGPGLR